VGKKAISVEKLLVRRAAQLSGDEAQRVSLARTFILDPKLLLMDEPNRIKECIEQRIKYNFHLRWV
jgi:ABC-type sugar transport system ATPase subunit